MHSRSVSWLVSYHFSSLATKLYYIKLIKRDILQPQETASWEKWILALRLFCGHVIDKLKAAVKRLCNLMLYVMWLMSLSLYVSIHRLPYLPSTWCLKRAMKENLYSYVYEHLFTICMSKVCGLLLLLLLIIFFSFHFIDMILPMNHIYDQFQIKDGHLNQG